MPEPSCVHRVCSPYTAVDLTVLTFMSQRFVSCSGVRLGLAFLLDFCAFMSACGQFPLWLWLEVTQLPCL